MTDHHGQHARCRACGTNPRARVETQAKEPDPAPKRPPVAWRPATEAEREHARRRLAEIKAGLKGSDQ